MTDICNCIISIKLAMRGVNYIFDNWYLHYVLDYVPTIGISVSELRDIMTPMEIYEENPKIYLEKCKGALFKYLHEKKIIFDQSER